MTREQDINLVRRAKEIVSKLEARKDGGTVRRDAAKQMRTLVRTAEYHFAVGHEKVARDLLEVAG